ncbi:hypothetical protein L211DRAFT_261322 [Terfezia boudieri ATCC MYA-4762]|uniref:Uncharacterized protein n=1 Tax=Terfezia boudieri ATCC MYA-4762 TaxID=1051890 RepID=A0A3N4M200_9PEZI|nr:hypothetical protein L211DRAFT_261322 [Terfezia boudieri ATCC MYA-4762]
MRNYPITNLPIVNQASKETSILIYTKDASPNMPIKVTDETSLERAFQNISRISHEVPGYTSPVLYRYSSDAPKMLLMPLYTRFMDTISDCGCRGQIPGLEPTVKTTTQMAMGQAVEWQRYPCNCSKCKTVPTTPCGRVCIILRIASFRMKDKPEGLAHSQTFFQPMSESMTQTSDWTFQRPKVKQRKNKDILFTYNNARGRNSELSFPVMVSDLLCIFQDGRWHIMTRNGGQAAKVFSTTPEYILAEVNDICAQWRLLIKDCKRFLSITNQEVLNEDVEAEFDQTLLKKLFKTAQIFEFLKTFHRGQFEGIKEIFAMIVDGKNNWESVQQKDTIDQLLSDFERIGDDIEKGLVKESSSLIERTHNILSIDEAFRSRAQNASIQRLSWITFIFLPLLFVAV